MPEVTAPAATSLPKPTEIAPIGAVGPIPTDASFWKLVLTLLEIGLPVSNTGAPQDSHTAFEDAILLATLCKNVGPAMCYGMSAAGRPATEWKMPKFPPMLEDLCRNSHEERLQRIRKAIFENSQPFGGSAFPIATFDHHVLVASAHRKLFRVTLDEANGQVRFAAIEEVGLPTIEEDIEVVSRGLTSTIDLLLEGKPVDARARLFDTLNNLGAARKPWGVKTDAALRRMPKTDSDWRRYVRENRARMRRVAKINETVDAPVPHYRDLYARKNPDVAGAKRTLTADVRRLREQVENLLTGLQRTLGDSMSRFACISETEVTAPVRRLTQFANAISADLTTLREVLDMADADLDAVGAARLHDAVAENMADYILAGRFVESTTRELSETVKSER